MKNKKIVMLAGEGNSTNILYHAISRRFPVHAVVMEKKEDRKTFIKRRIKKLGIGYVVGQIFFQLIIVQILNAVSGKRIKAIVAENKLNPDEIPADKIIRVISVNDENVKELLQQINPEVIIVSGTRIISKKILNAVNSSVINIHAGITPMYRGVHGGYWALVNNDKDNCGVTVHLVDAGIDTGGILYQKNIEITKHDNFITYPYLQTAQAISILQKAVDDILQNKLNIVIKNGPSKLWYHPTIWQYLYFRLFKNVK